MALATIVSCVVLIAVPHFGQSMVVLAWVLWWVDVALTVLASFGIPFIMCECHTWVPVFLDYIMFYSYALRSSAYYTSPLKSAVLQ